MYVTPELIETGEKAYPCFEKAEWFAIFSKGNLGLRFGPFTGPEIGSIIERARACKMDNLLIITATMGHDIDWEMLEDLKGRDEEWIRADERKRVVNMLKAEHEKSHIENIDRLTDLIQDPCDVV